jgi:hypothetical protein
MVGTYAKLPDQQAYLPFNHRVPGWSARGVEVSKLQGGVAIGRDSGSASRLMGPRIF